MELTGINSLLSYVTSVDVDAIVVEGYDGVGKGRVLSSISERLGVIPYRPDYNLWQKYDHRNIDRWKVSGFFWDIYSHFKMHSGKPMLFDRGVMSGAVYNKDVRIAEDYKGMLRDCKVLHILVTCNLEDYFKFQESRDAGFSESEIEEEYINYQNYTQSYVYMMNLAGVDYIIYKNEFDESAQFAERCISCGHYNYGYCRHPDIDYKVDPMRKRCNRSKDTEVQDINATEMHSM